MLLIANHENRLCNNVTKPVVERFFVIFDQTVKLNAFLPVSFSVRASG